MNRLAVRSSQGNRLTEAEIGWLNGQHIVVNGGLMAGFSAGWARSRP